MAACAAGFLTVKTLSVLVTNVFTAPCNMSDTWWALSQYLLNKWVEQINVFLPNRWLSFMWQFRLLPSFNSAVLQGLIAIYIWMIVRKETEKAFLLLKAWARSSLVTTLKCMGSLKIEYSCVPRKRRE